MKIVDNDIDDDSRRVWYRECEAVQDPYCSWNSTSNRCVFSPNTSVHRNFHCQLFPGIHSGTVRAM